MAEKNSKFRLKAPTVLWLTSAIVAAGFLFAWGSTSSGVWLTLLLLYACAIGYWNRHAAKKYRWMYASIWLASSVSLSVAVHPGIIACISIFFAAELYLLLGVAQVRFRDILRQLSLFYFLLSFAVFALYALEGPVKHAWGTALLVLVFLYLTGNEYVDAETGVLHMRMRVYMLACAFLTAQVLWLASLLSIGFLNVASLVLVLYITCMMLIVSHFFGTLTKKEIARNVWFFLLFSGVILLISQYV